MGAGSCRAGTVGAEDLGRLRRSGLKAVVMDCRLADRRQTFSCW